MNRDPHNVGSRRFCRETSTATRSVLGLALVLALGGSAAAESKKETAAAEYAEGQKLFKAKDFVGAAGHFKAAFAADEDPVYLFNIATALRLAKRCTESRDYYKKFLAAAPSAPNRDKIEKSLAEVEACAKTEKATPPVEIKHLEPVEKPVDPVETKPVLKPAETLVPPVVTKPEPPRIVDEPRADPGRTRRAFGIAAIGAGIVATGVGVFFVTRVSAAEKDQAALCPQPCTWSDELGARDAELENRGRGAQNAAAISLAVGGVALAGGAILYLTGRAKPEQPVAIVPTAGGAMVHTGFSF